MKQKTSSIIKIFVSLFFLGLLAFIMRNNLKNLLIILKQVKLNYFFLAIILFLAIIIILSMRLKRVMAIQNIEIPVRNVTYLSLIGFFFNNFLPTSVAGDFVKAHYTARYTNKTLESYTSIIIDRIFGLFSFILIAALALIFADKTLKSPLITYVILGMLLLAFFLILVISTDFLTDKFRNLVSRLKLSGLERKIHLFFKALAQYKGNLGIIFFAIYTSIIAQIASVLVVAILANGLSLKVSLGLLFLTLPIISVVSMLPSLNGLGLREGAYVLFLGKYVGKEHALAISVLWLGVMLAVSFVGGIVYFLKDILLKGGLQND